MKENPYRLDRTVEPLVYTVELKPDLKKFTFRGSESITIRAKKPFSKITLNAHELKIKKVLLCNRQLKKEVSARKISYNSKFETDGNGIE